MNRNTNTLLVTILLTLGAFFSIVYVSCKTGSGTSPLLDKCAAISCAYGGRCDQGKCICPVGYEGNNCEIISRDKFIGSYTVMEKGTITSYRQYTVAIEKDESANGVLIKNMYNFFTTSVHATIINDSIYVANQQLNGKLVFGKGYIYTDSLGTPNGRINMYYETVDSVNNLIVDDFGYYSQLDNSTVSKWQR